MRRFKVEERNQPLLSLTNTAATDRGRDQRKDVNEKHMPQDVYQEDNYTRREE